MLSERHSFTRQYFKVACQFILAVRNQLSYECYQALHHHCTYVDILILVDPFVLILGNISLPLVFHAAALHRMHLLVLEQ